MAPEREQRREYERSQVIAEARRLIAEGRALRERSRDLVRQVDRLTETFKRNHPEQ